MSMTFNRIKPSGISYYINHDVLAQTDFNEYSGQAVADGEASGNELDPIPATQADQ